MKNNRLYNYIGLLFIVLNCSSALCDSKEFSSENIAIKFDQPSEYKSYPGLGGTIVAFIANGNNEVSAATFSLSKIDESLTSNFLLNKELQSAFQKDILAQFNTSGFKNINQEPIQELKLGRKTVLYYPVSYTHKKNRLKTLVLLIDIGPKFSLTGRFTTHEKDFDKRWGRLQGHLASLEVKEQK